MGEWFEFRVDVGIGPTDRYDGIVSIAENFDNWLWHEGFEGKCNPLSVEVRERSADGTERRLRSQYTDGELFWIMEGHSKAGTERIFTVRFNTDPPRKGKLSPHNVVFVTDMGNELLFTINERELSRYRYRNVWKPYFHPVHGPHGIVTR